MSQHLLLTAWAFAPARTSGVYRAIGIANAFARQGWRVTVLTAPEKVFADEGIIDRSLSAQVDNNVRVVAVPFASGVYSSDISEWSWGRARSPELWTGVRGLRFPENGFGDWRPELVAAAENVHREDPVDLCLGTASPSVDFIPGWHLKRRHGVPYIMDYRDAWTIDVFSGGAQARLPRRAERWERVFLDAAAQVWFVNEPIRSWHEEKYPDVASRMQVVSNGFDLVAGASLAVPFRPLSPGRPLTFGYIGTINTGQFPTEALLRGWSLARQRSSDLAGAKISLRGYLGRTGVADVALSRFLAQAAEYGIVYEGPVAKAEVAEAYAAFDGLVLALASGPGVTSGKVFEFAGTGLPVVSVHDPNSAASAIMTGSPVWTPARTLDPEDVATAFIESAAVIRAQTASTRDDAVRWGAGWERMQQLERPVHELTVSLERSMN